LNEKITIEKYEITISRILRRSIQTAILKEIVNKDSETPVNNGKSLFGIFYA